VATLELKSLSRGGQKPLLLELFRCRDCAALLTDKRIKAGMCQGHIVGERVILKWQEKLAIALGLIS